LISFHDDVALLFAWPYCLFSFFSSNFFTILKGASGFVLRLHCSIRNRCGGGGRGGTRLQAWQKILCKTTQVINSETCLPGKKVHSHCLPYTVCQLVKFCTLVHAGVQKLFYKLRCRRKGHDFAINGNTSFLVRRVVAQQGCIKDE
jgi:hypothetical protein